MASMLAAPLVFNGRAGIWRIRKCLPGGCYSYVPWHIGLYRNDFGGKISQLGYSEPLMITLLTNFLQLHQLLVRYPSVFPFLDYGVPQAPSRIKLPRLSTRMRDSSSPPCVTIKVISLLVHRSILRNSMSSRVLTPDVVGIDALYTITKPFWQKLKAVWLPYLLQCPGVLCRHACTPG